MPSRIGEPRVPELEPDDALSPEELAARRALRREHDRRRHHRLLLTVAAPAALAVAVVVALVLAARGGSPAPEVGPVARPVPSAALTTGEPPQAVTLARIGRLDLQLPISRSQVTAVLFHPTAAPDAVPLTPVDGVDHELAPPDGRSGPRTAGVDVGAPAHALVYAPVDGVVTAVMPYRVLGRPAGLEIAITPTALTDVAVRMAHIEPTADGLKPEVGQAVGAGRTVLGRVRDFTGVADQELARYTSDVGNHVSVEVVRLASPGP